MARGYRSNAIVGGSSRKLVLYKNGDENAVVTGGYSHSDYTYVTSPYWQNGGTFTKNANNMYLLSTARDDYTYAMGTANRIDFTEYKTLYIRNNNQLYSLNVASVTGLYYLGFVSINQGDKGMVFVSNTKTALASNEVASTQVGGKSMTITEIWLEK